MRERDIDLVAADGALVGRKLWTLTGISWSTGIFAGSRLTFHADEKQPDSSRLHRVDRRRGDTRRDGRYWRAAGGLRRRAGASGAGREGRQQALRRSQSRRLGDLVDGSLRAVGRRKDGGGIQSQVPGHRGQPVAPNGAGPQHAPQPGPEGGEHRLRSLLLDGRGTLPAADQGEQPDSVHTAGPRLAAQALPE